MVVIVYVGSRNRCIWRYFNQILWDSTWSTNKEMSTEMCEVPWSTTRGSNQLYEREMAFRIETTVNVGW